MRYNIIRLAPLLAVIGSAAFAAGPDEAVQLPQTHNVAAFCETATVLDLVFNPDCNRSQKPLRVSDKPVQPNGRRVAPKAKRITKMPWQTGIFQ